MDVAVSVLRAELAEWIARARGGEEVVVTDRGMPVARLVGVETASLIGQLSQEGVLGPQQGPRPSARTGSRVQADGPVSELISDQRR